MEQHIKQSLDNCDEYLRQIQDKIYTIDKKTDDLILIKKPFVLQINNPTSKVVNYKFPHIPIHDSELILSEEEGEKSFNDINYDRMSVVDVIQLKSNKKSQLEQIIYFKNRGVSVPIITSTYFRKKTPKMINIYFPFQLGKNIEFTIPILPKTTLLIKLY